MNVFIQTINPLAFLIRVGCISSLGLLSSLAFAQGALETLVVTGVQQGSETPLAASIIRVDTAQQLPGLRIDSAELLQGIPGVQADSRSNYAQDTRVTLRGFGARSAFGVRGVDILLDGVPLSTPDGQGQLSSVSLDTIASVEVLRGPIAALYGNGAGGVVSLHSQAPTRSQLATRLAFGEDQLARQAVDGQWRHDNMGAQLQFAQFSTAGNRPHASAEREYLNGQFFYTSAQGVETILRLNSSSDPLLEDPLGLTPEQWRDDPTQENSQAELFNTRKKIDHQQMSVTVRQTEGAGRWQFSGWQGERDINQYLGFSGETSAGGVVDVQRDFAGLNGNYSQDFSLLNSPATATLGAEFAKMEDHRRGFVNDVGVLGELRRDEIGEVDARDIFSLLQWQPTQKLHVFGGARYSDVKFSVDDYFITAENPDDSGAKDFQKWSSAIGASYFLTTDTKLFASIGTGFETPTLTEASYQNSGTGLNTALDASGNRQQELGVSYAQGIYKDVSLTFFNIDSTDEIVVDESNNGRTTYRNAAETERYGVELAGTIVWSPVWSARLSASYLDAQYSAGEWENNLLPGVAKQNHYAQLNWQPLTDERLTFGVAVQHRSSVATNDNNEVFAPAATTADLSIHSAHSLAAWTLAMWLKLNNLTNEKYVGSVIVNQANGRSFEPAPDRNMTAGLELTYSFN